MIYNEHNRVVIIRMLFDSIMDFQTVIERGVTFSKLANLDK